MNTTTTVTAYNSCDVANTVNQAVRSGATVIVNGETVVDTGAFRTVASWGNGSVSYDVAGKKAGKTVTRYVKVGQEFTYTVAA